MNSFPKILELRLNRLSEISQRRSLSIRRGIDFSSNDYLGFSQDEHLRSMSHSRLSGIPVGSSASRLLRGHLKLYDDVEARLAEFCSQESALLFPSGYQANLGILSAVLTPEDLVFSDQLNHASLIDGIRLSGAKKVIYPNGNVEALRELLKENSDHSGLKVIVTESLFGMDGQIAPLQSLADLAEEFSAVLIVDEAHATGLWGDFKRNHGGGIIQSMGLSSRVFATIHTGGKALGVGGAWVCGSSKFKEYLINFSRPLIYSTAPLPVLAVYLQAALEYWAEVGISRALSVLEKTQYLRKSLSPLSRSGIEIPYSQGPILPVILGANSLALQISRLLQELGFDVRAIRPPTVPEGRSRIRLCVNYHLNYSDLDYLVQSFSTVIQELTGKDTIQ